MKSESLALSAVLMQMILLMGATISNVYFIDASDGISQTGAAISTLQGIVSFFDIIPTVSALDPSDIQNGIATCVRTNSGATCQEFPASECSAQCSSSCIPSSINNVNECRLGTCYSPTQGSCQIMAPRTTCESSGGQWYDSPNGNIPQCKRGCCILGQQSAFVTAQECSTMSSRLGVTRTFKSEVTTEVACVALSGGDREGACIIEKDGDNTCRFNTRAQCTQLRGEFHEGYLCSAPELRTSCTKQSAARCVDGKDEIYWFDSCGNRENIYSANRDQSWNNGRILPKAQSCSLGSGNNLDSNRATCGNCNYLLGTRCGAKTETQKLADNSINYVCRDLSCTDSTGKERKNGESWCVYQSSIGVDQGRSTDAAGSRHFRQLCINGNIQTEPCADFRNGICVESKNTQITGGFSSAACRANTWQQCINYNAQNATSECTKNPDCFLNNVYISPTYNFTICAPKYNPGFDLNTRAQGAELTCSIANQKCKVIYVKELAGLKVKWRCKQNCECETAAFTEKLNNLCMSLGDCGAKVNIGGKVSENYRISNAPRLSSGYLNGISRYATPVSGKYIDGSNYTAYAQSIGLGLPSNIDGELTDPTDAAIMNGLYTAGAMGATLAALAYLAPALAGVGGTSAVAAGAGAILGGIGAGGAGASAISAGIGAADALFAGGAIGGGNVIAVGGNTIAISTGTATTTYTATTAAEIGASSAVSSSPSYAAFGGAAAGAAIGLAVVSILLKATGVGRGLSPGVAYTLMGAGAVGGAMIGYSIIQGASAAAWVPVVGWILAGAAVIVTGVLKLVGVGDTKEVIVEFQCMPWQAPTRSANGGGEACNKCGQGGLPCSRYACQSLGQTCQLINEGTERPLCVDVSPNDVDAPIISPWNAALLTGYTYTAISEDGFKVKPVTQDCVPAYTQMQVGISLNEPAQCKFDYEHTNNYRDMEFNFGYRNLYLQNHSMNLSIPSLESLGVYEDDNGNTIAPTGDFNLYVRCQDRNGNANVREYNINFCVSRGNDVVPPVVTKVSPPTEEIAMNATQEDIVVMVNEPATCRISSTDGPYSTMATNMNCIHNATDQTAFGFICNTRVQIVQNVSNFYVRCADQPWLNATDYEAGKRHNENGRSLAITLRKTSRPLFIDSLEPNNRTITSNVRPATAEIIVRTSGGVDNGRATCYINVSSGWQQFFETGAATHKQVFNQLPSGNYTVQAYCADRVGNSAQKSSNFSIIIDNQVPIITRVYSEAQSLVVITDENSECRYSNRVCNFDFTDGSPMSGIDKEHSSPLDRNKDYYVMCQDRMGNKPGQCQITIREGRLV